MGMMRVTDRYVSLLNHRTDISVFDLNHNQSLLLIRSGTCCKPGKPNPGNGALEVGSDSFDSAKQVLEAKKPETPSRDQVMPHLTDPGVNGCRLLIQQGDLLATWTTLTP